METEDPKEVPSRSDALPWLASNKMQADEGLATQVGMKKIEKESSIHHVMFMQ